MTELKIDDPAWPVWHPITGGLADIDTYYRQWLQDPENCDDLPVIVTDGNGKFMRSDHKGWWYCCTADGAFDDEELPPGLLKIRAHMGKGCMYTTVAAPLCIGIIPGLGTAYQGILGMWEHPDGSTKIGDVWRFANGSLGIEDEHGLHQIVRTP
ncbi:MAG: hypothetical protein ABR608_13830 [Pseudonocardiaceae bacterium]